VGVSLMMRSRVGRSSQFAASAAAMATYWSPHDRVAVAR
jgi:hypothetical protein